MGSLKVISIWEQYSFYYLQGMSATLKIAAVSVLTSILFGIIIGILRLSKNFVLKNVFALYVSFIRGTPMLIQIYIIYYSLSFNMSMFTASVVALTVNASAYIGETVRGGIESIDKGQMEAARSLGMSHWQAMQEIVIPQAIKSILPSLCNQFIILIKNTSMMSVIGVHELMYNSNTVRANTYLAFEPLIIAATMYFVVCFVLEKGVNYLERRLKYSA